MYARTQYVEFMDITAREEFVAEVMSKFHRDDFEIEIIEDEADMRVHFYNSDLDVKVLGILDDSMLGGGDDLGVVNHWG